VALRSVYDPCTCNSGKKFKFCCQTTYKCGLCGNKEKLTRTECCNNLICDDESSYKLFSFGNNSCSKNHRTGTLCYHHYEGDHAGSWLDCLICKSEYQEEFYYYLAMSNYNFEKHKTPPPCAPIHCHKCNKPINIGLEDSFFTNNGHGCAQCCGNYF